MTLREIVVNIFKGILKYATIIICVALVGSWAYSYFFKPRADYIFETEVVRDTIEIARLSKEVAEKQKEIENNGKKEISLINRIFALEKELKAKSIITGDESPLEPIIVETVVRDTLYQREVYPYDLIYYGRVTEDEIVFMTLNPYLESEEQDFVKKYRWDRLWDEFEFIATKATETGTASVKLYASRPFVKWKGLYGGMGYDFNRAYLWLDARFEIYSFEIRPTLRSDSYLGIELGYKLFR